MNKKLQDGLIRLAYRLPMQPRRQLLYLVHQGRWARHRDPKLMTEKVNWRVLYDRRDLLSWTCDKLQMKLEAQRLCPDINVPKVYWSGRDVAELTNVELPDHWVLKPNHRSGFIHLGDGLVTDIDELRRLTDGWLDEANWKANGEWAYSLAERTLFVEEALGEPGRPPADYKFYVFDGKPRLVQVDRGRFNPDHSRRHYDENWEPVDLKVDLPFGPLEPRPEAFDRMLAIAGAVGSPFDFMRVDLYCIDGEVYLGEVTPYPASGHGRYEPRSLDVLMGSYWKLPTHLRRTWFRKVLCR